MYTLYYSPGAASFAVHWMLIEIGAAFELKLVDFTKREQKSSEYLKLNPLGQVPSLIVDGQPCNETAALLMLLAERHPDAKLGPPTACADRPKYFETMLYLSNTVQPAFRAFFYPQDFGDDLRADEIRENARGRAEAAFELLNNRFSDGREFLLGDSFSAADILLTMLARWSRKMPRSADSWPNLHRYLTLMRRREGLREVHKREGLTDWIELAETN